MTTSNKIIVSDDTFTKYDFSSVITEKDKIQAMESIKNMMAWSFMTSNATVEDRNDLWHTHHLTKQNKSISGIFYLHIPEDVLNFDMSGTEMAPNGMENPERVFVRPTPYSWLIYPSNVYHRPTPPQSNQFRYIVAADMEF